MGTTGNVSISANLSQLRAQIGAIPDVTRTEAKRMVAELNKQMRAAERASKAAAKNSGGAWKQYFTGVFTGAALMGGIKMLGGALKSLGKDVIDYRNELTDASARTGIATDTLQALRLSAEASGQEFGQLLKATEKIPKLLADVNAGSKRQIDAFKNLKVATHDETGAMRSADAVTRDIIKSLGSIKDPTIKAARGMDLFGRSGGKVVQALGAGAAKFEVYERIAKQFGVKTGPEAAESAALMQEEFARLGMVTRGLKDDLYDAFAGKGGGASGMRHFATAVVFIGNLIAEFVRQSKKSLGEFLEPFGAIADADGPVETMKALVGGWKQVAKVVGPQGGIFAGAEAVKNIAVAWDKAQMEAMKYAVGADESDKLGSAAAKALTDDIGGITKETKKAKDETLALAEAAQKAAASEATSYASSLAAIRQLRDDALTADQDAYATRDALYRDDLAALDAAARQALTVARGSSVQATQIDQEMADAKLAISAQYYRDIQKLRDEDLEAQREANTASVQLAISAGQLVADSLLTITGALVSARKADLDSLKDSFKRNREEMTQAERKAARIEIKEARARLRKIQRWEKAASLLSIAVDTAAGVMAVWAQFGAYPVLAASLSSLVTAAGATQAGVVAGQKASFHRGGLVDSASPGSDVVPANLLRGEAVLNRQATRRMGEEGVRALNAGASPMMPSVVLQIGRYEAREIIRTDLVGGGAIREEIGRLTSTRGTAGRSGLPVLA